MSWVKLLPLVAAVSGIALSYYYYIVNPAMPAKTVRAFKPLHTLFYNKWYFDELYDAVLVQPALAIGRVFWKKGDGAHDRRARPRRHRGAGHRTSPACSAGSRAGTCTTMPS